MKAADSDRSELLLLDTHALVWAMERRPRLGAKAADAVNLAARQDRLLVSAISPWEIALLVSKGRLKLGIDVMEWVNEALSRPGVRLAPLEPEIAVASTRLPFDMHPDPADRILVATARHLSAVLVTADGSLLELGKKRHFSVFNAEK